MPVRGYKQCILTTGNYKREGGALCAQISAGGKEIKEI
jgi:hypothetical protein